MIEAPAPIEQSRPIWTPGPITAVGPITVPAPTLAFGPITAPGSMVAPLSTTAEECTDAPGSTPCDPNNEDGRNESGNSRRATSTKARYGSLAQSTETPAGACFSWRSVIRHAPARVDASMSLYFVLS